MGDDQVVARELEQAEARLDEWKDVVADRFRSGEGPHELIALVNAAIDVGRLRALAVVEPIIEAAKKLEAALPFSSFEVDALRAVITAREEVQG